jgi:ribosomal-protein-alanine N-acetyltransferase
MRMTTETITPLVIETERLILQGISPAVIHHLFASQTDEEIKAFFGVDDEGFLFYRNMHEKGMETFRISHFSFLLRIKETNQPIGECGFHTWNNTHRRAELFYLLRNDEHKQRGFMSEALTTVLAHGYDVMNLHRVQAMVAPDNIPSICLLRKNGFTFEGTMRQDYVVDGVNTDSDCYSLLRDEWEVRRQA